MKKFLPIFLLTVIGFFVISCNDRTNERIIDNDTISIVRDVTLSFNPGNNFSPLLSINIPSSDVVLVYRRDIESAGVVWQQIPRTIYFNNGGELDYDFDFTTRDVKFYTRANFNLAAQSLDFNNTYLNNQIFRVVLVPAAFGKNANIDYSDYNSVAKYFNIDESKIINIKQ
jgi:hypothetical protein